MTLRNRQDAEIEVSDPIPRRHLPISTDEVLAGIAPARTLDLEELYGNRDLCRILRALGIQGPFRPVTPWELEDERGRNLIHAGGYSAVPFGEMYPPLLEFMHAFLDRGNTVGLAQYPTPWKSALAENLVSLLAADAPSHADSRVVFGNSGAEAVEAAIKLVRIGRPGARHLITFERGYHGKTAGALSVTPNAEYQDPFRPLLPHVRTLPFGDAEAFEKAVYEIGPDDVAAVIVEPVQGEGGVRIPPDDFLPSIGRLADRHGFLVIADEIQTGLGRTGHWFASLAAGLEPDIVTVAKPLGGGLVPIGAAIARKELVARMLPGFAAKRHSSTFAGNSLAMAVGMRSLELIVEQGLVERSRRLGEIGLRRLQSIADRHPGYIKGVRGAGLLLAIDVRHVLKPALLGGDAQLAGELSSVLAVREMHLGGVHVCFSANTVGTVRLTPPLTIPEDLFADMFDRLERVARRNRSAFAMLPRLPLPRLARLARIAVQKTP